MHINQIVRQQRVGLHSRVGSLIHNVNYNNRYTIFPIKTNVWGPFGHPRFPKGFSKFSQKSRGAPRDPCCHILLFFRYKFEGDCDSADDVGGHYYGGDVTSDPWTNVVYSGSSGTVTVDYGLSPSDAAGRSLVVHNSAGDRVTCAKYGESSSAMTFSLMVIIQSFSMTFCAISKFG